MALQTTALDNMFAQTLPKRRGTAEKRMPHGVVGVKRGNPSLFGTSSYNPRDARIARILGKNR